MDVNRTARIAAPAHGGQVLIADSARGLVEHALPEGVLLIRYRCRPQHANRAVPYDD
jgi:class 3 adenylate cyclase